MLYIIYIFIFVFIFVFLFCICIILLAKNMYDSIINVIVISHLSRWFDITYWHIVNYWRFHASWIINPLKCLGVIMRRDGFYCFIIHNHWYHRSLPYFFISNIMFYVLFMYDFFLLCVCVCEYCYCCYTLHTSFIQYTIVFSVLPLYNLQIQDIYIYIYKCIHSILSSCLIVFHIHFVAIVFNNNLSWSLTVSDGGKKAIFHAISLNKCRFSSIFPHHIIIIVIIIIWQLYIYIL